MERSDEALRRTVRERPYSALACAAAVGFLYAVVQFRHPVRDERETAPKTVLRAFHLFTSLTTVILAAGFVGTEPRVDISRGEARDIIRYCPISDGYEGMDRKVAVLGGEEARKRRQQEVAARAPRPCAVWRVSAADRRLSRRTCSDRCRQKLRRRLGVTPDVPEPR